MTPKREWLKGALQSVCPQANSEADDLADLAVQVAGLTENNEGAIAKLGNEVFRLVRTGRDDLIGRAIGAARTKGGSDAASVLVRMLESTAARYVVNSSSGPVFHSLFLLPVVVSEHAEKGEVPDELPTSEAFNRITQSFVRFGLFSKASTVLALPYLYRFDQLEALSFSEVARMHRAFVKLVFEGTAPSSTEMAQTSVRSWGDAMQDALSDDQRIYFMVFAHVVKGDAGKVLNMPWDSTGKLEPAPKQEEWTQEVLAALGEWLGRSREMMMLGAPGIFHAGLREGLGCWRRLCFYVASRLLLDEARAAGPRDIFAYLTPDSVGDRMMWQVQYQDAVTREVLGSCCYPLFDHEQHSSDTSEFRSVLDELGVSAVFSPGNPDPRDHSNTPKGPTLH